MLKRVLALPLCFVALTAQASSLYIAPSLVYDSYETNSNTSSNNVRFESIAIRPALGVGGRLYGSYFYLGAEIFANPKPWTIHNKKAGTPGLRTQYSYGASLQPGYYLDDMLLGYLRLGGMYTNFSSLNTTQPGWLVGAGLQAHLGGCWYVRGEYDYARFNSISGFGRPATGEYLLGLLYKFYEF